jgi:hypothetical protein
VNGAPGAWRLVNSGLRGCCLSLANMSDEQTRLPEDACKHSLSLFACRSKSIVPAEASMLSMAKDAAEYEVGLLTGDLPSAPTSLLIRTSSTMRVSRNWPVKYLEM